MIIKKMEKLKILTKRFEIFLKKRWVYVRRLRFLKKIKPIHRNKIISDIFKIIQKSKDPHFIDRNIHHFAFKPRKENENKWYNKDAEIWLIYNSLPLADSHTAKDIKRYLQEQKNKIKTSLFFVFL